MTNRPYSSANRARLLVLCVLIVGAVAGCGGSGGARVKMVAAEPILDGVPGWQETMHVQGHGPDQVADVRETWIAPAPAVEAKAEVERLYAENYVVNPGQIEGGVQIRWTTRDRKTTLDLDFRQIAADKTTVDVRLRRAP